MPFLNLKSNHKPVRTYYSELNGLRQLSFLHEGAVAPAFSKLLGDCARKLRWTLVEQHAMKAKGRQIRVDGAVVDDFKLVHGIWEAKDDADDLDQAILTPYPNLAKPMGR